MKREIELKYKINHIPEFCKTNKIKIKQFYFDYFNTINLIKPLFSLNKNSINECRVRVIEDHTSRQFVLTLKSGELNNRQEYEKIIDYKLAKNILKNNVTGVVEKHRYIYKFKNYVFEFDEYFNLDQKLFTVEVELSTIPKAEQIEEVEKILKNEFKLAFKNITNDSFYKNKNLAIKKGEYDEKEY